MILWFYPWTDAQMSNLPSWRWSELSCRRPWITWMISPWLQYKGGSWTRWTPRHPFQPRLFYSSRFHSTYYFPEVSTYFKMPVKATLLPTLTRYWQFVLFRCLAMLWHARGKRHTTQCKSRGYNSSQAVRPFMLKRYFTSEEKKVKWNTYSTINSVYFQC